MANELQIFRNEEFGEIRVVTVNNEPWFVGKDVAEKLGYTDTRHAILDHIDDDDKINSKTRGHFDPEFGQRGTWLINESGVYSLILSSKLPSAKQFKRWVTSEVLPSIRKNGGYIQTTPTMSNEEIMARAVLLGQKTIEELTKQIEEIKPKRIFADAVTASTSSILVGDLAKLLKQNGIDIGQQRLFEWLRRYGYVIKYGRSRNIPTQYSMDLGLMEIEEKVVRKDNDRYIVNKLTKITTKGQQYFINKFLNEQQIS